MSTKTIGVAFADNHRCRIPLGDLAAVCAVGSYAIVLPVPSKEAFDHLKTFVEKHKPLARNTRWGDDIYDWQVEFIEQFTDRNKLDDLAEVAKLTKQRSLECLCEKRLSDLVLGGMIEEDDLRGDDDDDDDEYYNDHNTIIMRKSPSPDILPEDEDEFWEGHCREEDELYGDDRESPSP